nr:VOC family protein [Angustibacter aerolatus]
MPKTTPWLWFDGTALDAARLYCSLFPNSRITSEVPTNDAMPDGEAETPIVVTWNLDGQDYAGLNGGPQFPQTEAFSIMVSLRRPGRGRPLLGRADRRRRPGVAVRLAQGPLRRLVADRAHPAHGACRATPIASAPPAPRRRCSA